MALDFIDRNSHSSGHFDDHDDIVVEVNRIGAIADALPEPTDLVTTAALEEALGDLPGAQYDVITTGGGVAIELAPSAWVVGTDGTPYYDPEGTQAGVRGLLQISPVDGGYVVATP